jgi:hypothetical protein
MRHVLSTVLKALLALGIVAALAAPAGAGDDSPRGPFDPFDPQITDRDCAYRWVCMPIPGGLFCTHVMICTRY